jgi:hypothetical protein
MAAPVAAAAQPPWTVVAKGLDNPRGLRFLANGKLIVAESGHAGDTSVYGGAFCLGLTAGTSSVDIRTGLKTPLVTELPSWFLPLSHSVWGECGFTADGSSR